MTTVLTLDLIQNLDIQVGRVMGLLKDMRYVRLVREYELDTTQCMLWLDVSQALSYVMDNNGYEDLELSDERLGLEIKKVLATQADKFMYLKQLLIQYDILHENRKVGKTIHEILEDIQVIYRSIEKDLKKIFSTQKDIESWIKDSLK